MFTVTSSVPSEKVSFSVSKSPFALPGSTKCQPSWSSGRFAKRSSSHFCSKKDAVLSLWAGLRPMVADAHAGVARARQAVAAVAVRTARVTRRRCDMRFPPKESRGDVT
ncbi:hypothetical protein [Micromonospora sp. KC207]|uniref:hypothetical protein n=1 Tax=Micromonospora sp. KC207 TaxID=2530377 RepID=UPI00352E84FF